MINTYTNIFMSLLLMFGLTACHSGSSSPSSSSANSDVPVLTRIGIADGYSSSNASALKTSAVANGKDILSAATATATFADYYAGLGETISLYIEISNPSGYSISRFKINGTAYTSGSFSTDPIQPGQTTTVIRIASISLGTIMQTITYTISEIKYIAEIGSSSGTEKDVVINANSLTSTTVSVGFSGSGTMADPYLITNKGQLKAVARCTNGNINGVDGYNGKYLKLTADIDLSGENWTPIGTYNLDFIYDYSFKGTFDGSAKTISNLTINNSLSSAIGLFGAVYGGTIKNAVLTNCRITNLKVQGITGGITGWLENGLISQCSSTGNIHVTGSVSITAGIAGYVANSTIDACANSATILSDTNAKLNTYAGGIAGYAYGSSIQNSYNTGSISALGIMYNVAGGIAGSMSGNSVTNCYNVGTISESNTAPAYNWCASDYGIVGEIDEFITPITNSVWLAGSAASISCSGTGTVATGNSSTDMMSQATYTDLGWDFSSVWKINAGEYPKLMWQN